MLFKSTLKELKANMLSLRQSVATAVFLRDKIHAANEEEFQRKVLELDSLFLEKQASIVTGYEEAQEELLRARSEFLNVHSYSAAAWDHESWASWKPGKGQSNYKSSRIGNYQVEVQGLQFEFPAMIDLVGKEGVLFNTTPENKDQALSAIQSLLLRLAASIPPGKLQFIFLDPVGLGQNVAGFMHLIDHDEKLVTSRAWTEPQHIASQLSRLTDHMETVIQKYLRNLYINIEDYNEEAGEIKEPYRVLVALDFPTSFDEATARRLVSIVQNGPRCGVFSVILVDKTKPLPYGFNIEDLEGKITKIDWVDARQCFVIHNYGVAEYKLRLDQVPEPKFFTEILKQVGQASKDQSTVQVPFSRIMPKDNLFWKKSAADGIQIKLGPSGARKFQWLKLGQGTAQHVLVAGKTGSGKSTLLHVLINNLALNYSPDELQLYLIDFKEGVEFKVYAGKEEFPPLPHARVVAIESEREFGLSVLQGLDREMVQRGDLFRSAGADKISDYRNKSGELLPRILLIVDEFHEFFTEEDSLSSLASKF